jgi:hypothetical protein
MRSIRFVFDKFRREEWTQGETDRRQRLKNVLLSWLPLAASGDLSGPAQSGPYSGNKIPYPHGEKLQMSIHQQSTGRCLAFLILLGDLCKKLAGEYDDLLELGVYIDNLPGFLADRVFLTRLNLQPTISPKGIDWDRSEDAFLS